MKGVRMARHNKAISLTEWEVDSEGRKGRRNFHTIKCPESIVRANKVEDQTYRRIRITCAPIEGRFRITSGREVYIPIALRRHLETGSKAIFCLLD